MNEFPFPEQRKGRGYTHDLWRMIPLDAMASDPHFGSRWREDFKELPTGRYTGTDIGAPSGSAFALVAGRHGIARLTPSTAGTDAVGHNVQCGPGSVLVGTNNRVAFEALVRFGGAFNATTEVPQSLIGLAETDTSLLSTAGALAVDDFIGFLTAGGDMNLDFHVRVGGVSVSKLSVATIVKDTWMHLGFLVEDGKLFTPFVNKLRVDDAIINDADAAPTEVLTPSWAMVGAGATANLDIDWHDSADSYMADVRT